MDVPRQPAHSCTNAKYFMAETQKETQAPQRPGFGVKPAKAGARPLILVPPSIQIYRRSRSNTSLSINKKLSLECAESCKVSRAVKVAHKK